MSSEYDNTKATSPWAPFQRTKIYDIPERIFEQYNQAQVSTMMGLMAEINHAWISIDNALYLWDYTHPNPELIGFEDQPNNITAVKLVVPRQGVFVPSINYVLVVATTADILLIGVACADGANGAKNVTLYQTKMSVSIRGLDITVIQGSPASGRIFFGGKTDDDVYEFTYHSQEKWFQSQCSKINHTTKGFANLAPSFSFQARQTEYIEQMVIDDSRNLLYTLSSASTIKTFHLKPNNGLDLAITQPFNRTYTNLRHLLSSTPLIDLNTKIVSISTISSREATKLHLAAVTSTGVRLFMSATSSMSWNMTESTSAPTSMQVQHVKFPPASTQAASTSRQSAGGYQNPSLIDTGSRSLTPTRFAVRFAPGYFLDFSPSDSVDRLFLSSPDSGRIAMPQDTSQVTRYYENGQWIDLESHAEDVGLISPQYFARTSPVGFGNEPATQYDRQAVEIAILTNTGVHVIRRKRLVDVLASLIKQSSGEDQIDAEIKKFIRLYGRGETASSALAVACGQGVDFSSDGRNPKMTDPDVLEAARKAFINYGGKATFNENSVLDQSIPAIDNVKPSPRHDGLALYISRLVRSIWKSKIVKEVSSPTGGIAHISAVPITRLAAIQRDLTKLQEFLSANQSYIDGLAGPESLQRISNKQEEVALQAEHRALHSLVLLIADIIEGISFVLVLFDEKVDETILSLPDTSRQQVRQLTYEYLFASDLGKELAKEMVKAIVNRNIASGSNIDTVAESLRRRCGSFCSSDDVIVFKAQELLKRASEDGGSSEHSRNLLREALRLFEQVAGNLSTENLEAAMQQFSATKFYAGAIQLGLKAAKDSDPGNKALAFIADGKPEGDPRKQAFDARNRCYDMVFQIITAVDHAASQSPTLVDGHLSQTAKLKAEAYEVVYETQDEAFQTALYDWYLAQGWTDRLLEANSGYVIGYLQRRFKEGPVYADLLWRYHAVRNNFYEAAAVQLQLIRSGFDLTLERRIEYLSQAKAMAQSYTPGVGRQRVQVLLHEISDLLDVANIQDDVLQRISNDGRVAPEQRAKIVKELNSTILELSEVRYSYILSFPEC
jgi:nuclear pore complex protein Nup155